MAKFNLKLQALDLRRSGESIKTIADLIGVSKATVSIWCRDIELTEIQKKRLRNRQIAAGHKGRMIGAEMNRKKKLENISIQEKIAKGMVGTLSKRDMLMLGIGLYWGEGVKRGTGGAAIINSDPQLILFARNWLEHLGVPREDFRPYIYISEHHRKREQKLLQYWSKQLAIPRQQFNKVIFLSGRRKKVYENHDLYYGIIALRVRKSSSLKYRILGLIEACKGTMPG